SLSEPTFEDDGGHSQGVGFVYASANEGEKFVDLEDTNIISKGDDVPIHP
ncbi:hypothetical protein Tco_1495420, partial [Tanacetum coccineum]